MKRKFKYMFNTKTKITSVILSSLICSSQIISANPVPNKKIHDTSKKISYENKESWISANRGKLGILTGMFVIPGITTVGLMGLAKLGCTFSNELYKTMLETKHFKLENNKYTPQQRGLAWCWLACLEGIYRSHGKENITQEYIHKQLGMKDLYFYILRFNAQPLGEALKIIRDKINECSKDFKFVTATIKSNSANIIEKSILDYYNKIGKKPFSTVDSLVMPESGDGRKMFHMVNIVNIDEKTKEITIEDPQIGMSRKQSLTDFCQSYSRQLLEVSDIIPLQTIVPRTLNIPDNIRYIDSDESIVKITEDN